MALRIADDGDAAAVRPDGLALGDRLGRVVRALAVHIRPQHAEQPIDRAIRKHDDVVDAAQRRNQLRARLGRHQRPAWTFQRPHRRVVVHRDDQPIGFPRRSVFIVDGDGVVRYAHRAIAGLTYRPISELVGVLASL